VRNGIRHLLPVKNDAAFTPDQEVQGFLMKKAALCPFSFLNRQVVTDIIDKSHIRIEHRRARNESQIKKYESFIEKL
jgi:hypothetical protein